MHFFFIFKAVFLTIGFKSINCQKDISHDTKGCDKKNEFHLKGTGTESSLTLDLSDLVSFDQSTDIRNVCPIKITAPDTHLIYIRFVEESNFETTNSTTNQSCSINAYVSENWKIPAWSGDACDKDFSQYGLLTNVIMLIWRPPDHKHHIKHNQLIITALGKGEFCRKKNQHTCIQVGWTPIVCVAEELLCDDTIHCPPGAIIGDEDPQFCRDRIVLSATNWEKIATDFLKKFTGKSKPGSLLPPGDSNENQVSDNNEGQTEPPESEESLSAALAHYGPWGYLMLGMLVCGTVLMFCGLWECCCRRPKPNCSTETIPQTTAPPTVLIVSPTDETQTPPRYEDLDQPPSYTTLFPDLKNRDNQGAEFSQTCLAEGVDSHA